MNERYKKNIDIIFTENIQNSLLEKTIGVIGCGGQGSYILEFLIRLGVKKIVFWDGDFYSLSNINRQFGCSESTLNKNKALVLCEYLSQINSQTEINACNWFFGDKKTDISLAQKCDFIFYCADCYYNIVTLRLMIKELILKDIPVIDCPVQLLGGYVFIETKQDLHHYDIVTEQLIEQSKRSHEHCSQPAYKCALIAAEAVNQMVQFFSQSRYANINSELIIDIYHHKYIEKDRYSIC